MVKKVKEQVCDDALFQLLILALVRQSWGVGCAVLGGRGPLLFQGPLFPLMS